VNQYLHHIGDFNNATRHLTRVERSIYSDMIDMYYDTEQPLLLDVAALKRKLLARTKEESAAVDVVLQEFFTETAQGWFNERCDFEITKFHSNSTKKSIAGKASAAKREQTRIKRIAELNGHSTDVEQVLESVGTDEQQNPTNHKPITDNHKPITNINTQEGEVLELEKLNKYLQRAIVPEITQERLNSLLDGFNAHYETWTLSPSQRYNKMVAWIKKANEDDRINEARLQRATATTKKPTNAKEPQAEKGKSYFGFTQQEIEAQAREGESYYDTAKRMNDAKGDTPAQDVEPKPLRAFAGIDLQIFKTIQQLDPKITQQAVIDLAKQQGKDEYTTMVKLHMQLKSEAAKVKVAQ